MENTSEKPKRRKEIQSYTEVDFYSHYLDKIKHNKNSKYYLSKVEFANICKDFNQLISEKILREGYIFKLPFYLGRIYIKKVAMPVKKEKLHLDYKKTKELNKPIYHMNTHSRDNFYRWQWQKADRLNTHMRKLYKFVPTRKNKRTLAKIILNREFDYIG